MKRPTNKRKIDKDLVGLELEPIRWSWDESDTILYALAVGATVAANLDSLYEKRGPVTLPTFGVIPSTLFLSASLEAIDFNLANLLHVGQTLTLFRPLPPRGEVETTRRIINVWDKGNSAIVEWESISSDDAGQLIRSSSSLFHRGAGGFDGDRGPKSEGLSYSERIPDFVIDAPTSPEQSALYRLCGDANPIHIDPDFARASGYDKPFLHGLCTYGIVARVVLDCFNTDHPSSLLTFDARFRDLVFPGDALRISIWLLNPGEAAFEVSTNRGIVMSDGYATYSNDGHGSR